MINSISNINFTSKQVKSFRQVCNEMNNLLEKLPGEHNVSCDIAELNGKFILSTGKIGDNNALWARLNRNDSSAFVLLKEGSKNDLQKYLKKVPEKSLYRDILDLSSVLKKVERDEPKSLIDFS